LLNREEDKVILEKLEELGLRRTTGEMIAKILTARTVEQVIIYNDNKNINMVFKGVFEISL